ncbi:MAG TPA: nuclear transport factor 2 family protein [Gemmatimonadaceae bacterium]|jgi:ketosteroid isomerase-like protein
MRKFIERAVVIPMIAVVVGACSMGMQANPTTSGFAADAAAIRAVFDTTTAGWNRGELSGYLSAYVDTARAGGSTGFVQGVKAIGDQMRSGFWKTGKPLQQLRYEHLEIRPLGRDYALATGQYVLSGGDLKDRTGWFTTIWTRTPAGWRMMHDHS